MDFIYDLQHVQFSIFSLGLCEGTGVCSPLPVNLEEIRKRFTTALMTFVQDMLQRVWEELDYRIELCRVSGGAHNEHL